LQYAFLTAKPIPPALPEIGGSIYFVIRNTDPKYGHKLGVEAFGFSGKEVPAAESGKKPN